MIDLKNNKRIAVIQTAFLGDVVLSLPLIQTIKNNIPTAEITLVTTPAAASLGDIAIAVDRVMIYDKRQEHSGLSGISHIVSLLKEHEIQCIVGMHRSLRSSLINYFVDPEMSVGFRNAALSFFYRKRVPYINHLHEIDRNLELLSVFNNIHSICDSLSGVELNDLSEETEDIDSLMKRLNVDLTKGIIAIAPGSVWQTKKWRKEYYAKLSEKLLKSDFIPVMIGSKEDSELCKEIADISGSVSIAGETTLPQTIVFLKQAKAIVTNDSAPTHLAGLAGIPCMTIFGPTSPIFGFAPRGDNDKVIQDETLKCRPCRIHGSKKCPIGTHECMTNIKPDTIYENVMEMVF